MSNFDILSFRGAELDARGRTQEMVVGLPGLWACLRAPLLLLLVVVVVVVVVFCIP